MLVDKNFKNSKAGILLLLLIQNTGLALAVKASKSTGSGYIASTAVFLNEFVKLLISIVGFYRESPNQAKRGIRFFISTIFDAENLKFAVPCLIYAVQNNLIFVVLRYIDAALYQVLSNLKIITTAIFSVVLLGKKLHRLQWLALLLLACGEALAETATAKEGESNNALIGTLLMCFYAGLSGLAGVFTEKMLKKNNVLSFWLKQILLYFWGSVITLIGMMLADGSEISEKGLLYGYTKETWLVVFLLSFGGLLVSAVITQFDNIVKVYVTCCSLFLTSFLSWLLLDFHYNLQFILAALIVSISILVYSDPATTQ